MRFTGDPLTKLTNGGQPDSGPARKHVFVIDDHPIFCQGLAKLINAEPDFEVCGESANASEAIDALRRVPADVAIVDISLPGSDGIELTKCIRAEHPRLPILIISAHDEQTYAMRALRAGASGYLMKREGADFLIPALRNVLAGKIWVSPVFSQQLIFKVSQGSNQEHSLLDSLSDRELEVLRLIGEGKSSRDIADALHISVKTVETHRLHVREKLCLESSADLVRFAADWASQGQPGPARASQGQPGPARASQGQPVG